MNIFETSRNKLLKLNRYLIVLKGEKYLGQEQYQYHAHNLRGSNPIIIVSNYANNQILSLYIGNFPLRPKEKIRIFGEICSENIYLEHLYLCNCYLKSSDIRFFVEKLMNVKTLSFPSNNICCLGAKLISNLLNTSINLTELDLSANVIGDKGAESIFESISSNKFLTKLLMCGTKINYRGAKYIGKSLKRNSTLLYLHLGNNKMGDRGIEYITDGLSKNNSLQSLILFGNKITDIGVNMICQTLYLNNSLTYLDIHANNSITNSGVTTFNNMMDYNSSLCNTIISKYEESEILTEIEQKTNRNAYNQCRNGRLFDLLFERYLKY